MSNKVTIALALTAGFIGGIVSQRIVPAPVWAQDQAAVPQEIRAHKFILVDEAGVDRGAWGFGTTEKGEVYPFLEMMNAKGSTWTARWWESHNVLLPDATCQTCVRKH